MGIGTQKIEQEVRKLFDNVGVVRWDSDTVRNFSDHQNLLKQFLQEENQILIGTQMVAKGLDVPSVSLVGVVNADIGLNIPDLRASERSFQLLCQVAGRAGRGDIDGKVIIQFPSRNISDNCHIFQTIEAHDICQCVSACANADEQELDSVGFFERVHEVDNYVHVLCGA